MREKDSGMSRSKTKITHLSKWQISKLTILNNKFLASNYKISVDKYLGIVSSNESNCTIANRVSEFQKALE